MRAHNNDTRVRDRRIIARIMRGRLRKRNRIARTARPENNADRPYNTASGTEYQCGETTNTENEDRCRYAYSVCTRIGIKTANKRLVSTPRRRRCSTFCVPNHLRKRLYLIIIIVIVIIIIIIIIIIIMFIGSLVF
jgi:hypothetical protein